VLGRIRRSHRQGEFRLDYDPAGIVCTIEAPLAEMQRP
jgi:hypothetical protein